MTERPDLKGTELATAVPPQPRIPDAKVSVRRRRGARKPALKLRNRTPLRRRVFRKSRRNAAEMADRVFKPDLAKRRSPH